ncbi:CG12061, partial [Drosophila busckii]
NCTPPAIMDFPNFMREKSILYTCICIVCTLYFFVMLAIVCDDYLVTSMERLCYTLRMPYDVAGATFLAAATSAPELFVSLISTFITKGDLGIGTIVGSSVFNVLAIAAVCGLLSPAATLDWWPISRDTLWYLIAIAVLFVFVFDSHIKLYEAGIMFGLYFVYLVLLIFDRKIQKKIRKIELELDIMDEDPLVREEDPIKSFREHICDFPTKEDHWCKKIWFYIKYPAEVLLAITTPSARWIFFLTLFVAVLWISVISYMVAWFLTIVGYNFGIPDSIMGLTVLAIGTSVPEVCSSYIVSNKGYGSMAMCNAIGSNTFDIFVCLGLPWIISILIYKQDVVINSSGLAVTTGMLVLTALLLYILFLITKFVLGKFIGAATLIGYIIFLAVSCTLEIIWLKPMCDE